MSSFLPGRSEVCVFKWGYRRGLKSTAVSDEELEMKTLDSTLTGGATHSPPPAEPFPIHGEEEEARDEDIKAPVELIMKFLRAVMDRDLQQASKLCQMILIYEPDHPEASEFLPLIQKKLSDEQEAEQEAEQSTEEGGDDEESSQSSSCSSSPSDDDEEKQVNRHKPCPPPHFLP